MVAGGLVYMAMFRRQLLGGLNAVWRHIEELKHEPPVVRRALPREVKGEILRFVALVPLAQMDFRLKMEPQVSASDASSTGGGLSASRGLTAYGLHAQSALLRGEVEEPFEAVEVLTIGLFDGISALRVAAEVLQLPVAGHISVECHPGAARVVEAAFPGSRHVANVLDIDLAMVRGWSAEYPMVGVVLLGAGPPCQGVSGLNFDRLGSQRDARSCLYKEVPKVRDLVQQCFPWAQVHVFVESVASMDAVDRAAMSAGFGLEPYQVDAAGVSLCRRPRVYWLTWELLAEEGLQVGPVLGSGWHAIRSVDLQANVDQKEFLEAGWYLPPGVRLPTFTTSRPSATPGRRPAGLKNCNPEAKARWSQDDHRYPPYQYKTENCVLHPSKPPRVASILEREVILGFPAHYTEQCLPKAQRQGSLWEDMRKTLLGNTWSVPVVVILLKQLFERLGVCPTTTIQQVVDRCTPGKGMRLQTVLQRPPVTRDRPDCHRDEGLARRLSTLVSTKGEDLLLQGASESLVQHQRLRQTIPARLWKWQEIAGWQWKDKGDHINLLEMRATLTSVKWMLQKRKSWNCRVIHLVDSLVVLHALTRGRSSSRKLRRTLMRINALLLASNLHPVWTYLRSHLPESGRSAESPYKMPQMGKGQKRLEGRTKQQRQKIRKQMGPLKSLTLQPRTRARYDKAKGKFYAYLDYNSLELPSQKALLDGLLCDYLEYLWSAGEGRALASDTLAALQDVSPRIKGSIPGAWRLLRTWHANEIPNRAPPFPERILHAMVGYFLFHEQPRMALSLLLGFYAMLRTGELLGVRNKDVTLDVQNSTAVISLGMTKGGKRSGAAESVTVAVTEVVRRLAQWKKATPAGSLLCPSPQVWRKSFSEALEALSLDSWEFRPYSLRRGGATFWFSKHGSLDRILLQGRWMAARTARTYLNEGPAVLAEMQLPIKSLRPFHLVYTNAIKSSLPKWR